MAEGKVQLEIQYCVPCGYFWQAATVAGQVVAGRNREIGVTLTPAGQGRFEVYLDGDLIYNRKEPADAVLQDPVGDVRNAVSVAELIRTKVLAKLARIDAEQPVAVGAGR
jgi:selT/selW/selH-like putative selenoprotein